MANRKKIRTRGKLQLSRWFQSLKDGQRVSIIREASIPVNFPKRLQGKTGIIEGKKGREYVVGISEGSKEKKFIINPIHLKKIKQNDRE